MKKLILIAVFTCINLGILLYAVQLPENCIKDGIKQYCKNEVMTSNYCSYWDSQNQCYEISAYLRACTAGENECTPQECNTLVGCLQIL
jgi:hypothetical protein